MLQCHSVWVESWDVFREVGEKEWCSWRLSGVCACVPATLDTFRWRRVDDAMVVD